MQDTTRIELHQASGSNYRSWAGGNVTLRPLLESREDGQSSDMHITCELYATDIERKGAVFATIQLYIRLLVPAQTALALYRVRFTSCI